MPDPLLGVTYDQHDDLIAVMAEGVDHMTRKPREVFIESEGVDLLSMQVIDGDGITRIVRFREPQLLPALATRPHGAFLKKAGFPRLFLIPP